MNSRNGQDVPLQPKDTKKNKLASSNILSCTVPHDSIVFFILSLPFFLLTEKNKKLKK
jgi:hypothetical protein